MPDSKKPELKTETPLDEKIRVGYRMLVAVCTYLVFLAIAILLSPEIFFLPLRKAPTPPPPEVEKVVVGHENYPKTWNYFLPDDIRDQHIRILSNWDGLTLAERVDTTSFGNVEEIRNNNPDLINLVYKISNEARCPDAPGYKSDFDNLVRDNDWWLYDYEGNRTSQWPGNCSINQTYLLAGCDPNNQDSYYENEDCVFEAMANFIINESVERYPTIWDGVFYDVFSDTQRWYSHCRKDADRNEKPTLDYAGQIEDLANDQDPDNDCPYEDPNAYEDFYFDNKWNQGMVALVDYTLELSNPDLPIVGNGLNRNTLSQTNGTMVENFGQNSDKNIHHLCNAQHYILNTQKDPPISIINSMPRRTSEVYYTNHEEPYPLNDTWENPEDYQNLRWTMGATLLTDAYFSYDFGSQNHGETIWYDEYNIKPDGEVVAVTTVLSQNVDMTQQTIPVASTDVFTDSGLILIDGEQIWYYEKGDDYLLAGDDPNTEEVEVGRGYPGNDFKYNLRAPHEAGEDTLVIQYDTVNENGPNYTGYLGAPQNDAYDLNKPNDPTAVLNYLIDGPDWPNAGQWYCWAADSDINSRIYQRDFEYGTVVVNPRDEAVTLIVNGTGENSLTLDGTYRLINGLQDPAHNNGDPLTDGYQLTIQSQDSYILIKTQETGSLDLTLSGDSEVPQGGTLNLDITVTNNTMDNQIFDLWFDLTPEEGQTKEISSTFFDDAELYPGQTLELSQSVAIRSDTQPGLYTITAYVGPDYTNRDIYDDSDDHQFEVTGQYNPQNRIPEELEIEGSTTKLWQEAESGTLTLPMVTASDPEASDGQYILVPDGTQNYGPGQAQFTLNIPESGNYVIWGRAMTPDGNADSFRVQMDTEAEDEWHVFQQDIDPFRDTWGWDQVSYIGNGTIPDPEFDPQIFNLSQGTHNLYIKNREDGTKLDKLLITNDMDYVPEGFGG